MPPHTNIINDLNNGKFLLETTTQDVGKFEKISEDYKNSYKTLWGRFETPLIWSRIVIIFVTHVVAIYGFATFPYIQKYKTFLFAYTLGIIGGFGVTGGAHRYWCHRTYKAKIPLRIILMLSYVIAGQNKLHDWVRDHRVHHKYSETSADPHNSNRGFFFSHIGWLMMRKHPDVIEKGNKVDCIDLFEDPVLLFHERHFLKLKIILGCIIPALIPYYCWNETIYWSCMSILGRLILSLNITFLVNSAAHLYGKRPYDKNIQPVENITVAFVTLGEGWHNYHHAFPWDYKAGELGYYNGNITAFVIRIFEKIGWAYDLKTPSKELIHKYIQNNGDGSHIASKIEYETKDK